MKPRMFQSALLGGVVLGVLSALPIVSAGNFCCCLWVVAGGLVAAYLFQAATPQPITNGDGALVGLLAGLIGACIQLVLTLILNPILRPVQEAMLEWASEQIPNAPAGTWDAGFGLAGTLFTFILMLIVGAIFSTAGGILGAVFFRKKLPPVLPPEL